MREITNRYEMEAEEADAYTEELKDQARESKRAKAQSERHADDAMREEALAEDARRGGFPDLADLHAEEAHAARFRAAEACQHNGGISLPKECGGGARCYDCPPARGAWPCQSRHDNPGGTMIKIEIDTGNAAFEPDPRQEAARILTDLCKLLKGQLVEGDSVNLKDANGNTCGFFEWRGE
jgi:hypothetical protein